jgi:hypothetical protein
VFDEFIKGPDRSECLRKVLVEKRDACSDPNEAAFLMQRHHHSGKERRIAATWNSAATKCVAVVGVV